MKEQNSFDRCVEMFADQGADTIMLENFKDGLVAGSPYNSKTGDHWLGMTLISSIEEAANCKYLKGCDENDKELVAALDKLVPKKPEKKTK